ncbi:MAG: glycosyltransferase [Candidatus Eremiobacteraeota bacterium]|nr:glycosyltransferase [Candidatus Eremiobacteraeota bacterium]
MRIGMFIDCYHPIINGVTTEVEELKKTLENLGVEVFLFVPKAPGYVEEDRVYRFSSIAFPFQPEHRFTFPFPRKILDTTDKLALDLIHLHTPFNVGWIGLYKAKKLGIPVVFTHHTFWEDYVHYFPLLPRGIARKVAYYLYHFISNRSKYIIAPSREAKKRLENIGINTTIEVIPGGINLELFSPTGGEEIREEILGKSGKYLLLYVGRLGKEKNLGYLVSMMGHLYRRDKSIRLLIVGDGPVREDLERKTWELGIEDVVIFRGYVPRENLPPYYAGADLMVFSSKTETQGVVLVESLACGTPVIAVSAEAQNELLSGKGCGVLVSGGPDEFARIVFGLLHDPEKLKRMRKEGLKVAGLYSRQVMGGKILDLYNKTVEKNEKKPL